MSTQVPSQRDAEPPPVMALPQAPFVALVLLVVVGGVLGILLLNTKINENAFVLQELHRDQAELDQRQQELEQEIAEARSAAQLAAVARRLGLVDRQEDLDYLRIPAMRGPAGEVSDDESAQ